MSPAFAHFSAPPERFIFTALVNSSCSSDVARPMLGLIQLFRSPPPPPPVSLIDDATTIVGDTITGTGDLRIEGTVQADIEREGRVVISRNGTVHGTIHAQSIRVAGTVRGELHAEDTLDLTAAADVRAHLSADELTIDSGADFKGNVYNGDPDPSLMSPLAADLPAIPPEYSPPAEAAKIRSTEA